MLSQQGNTNILLITAAIYLFALSLLIPIFPKLITYSNEYPEDEIETTRKFGTLQIIKNVLDLLFLPILGGISDFVGRKVVLLFCLLLALVQLILILPPSFTSASYSTYWVTLLASRVLSGISDGVLVILFASLTDLANGDAVKLPTFFGKVGLVFGISFTLGPMTSVILFSLFGVLPVLSSAILCVCISIVICLFFFIDTLPVTNRQRIPKNCLTNKQFLLQLTPYEQFIFLKYSPVIKLFIVPFFFHELGTTVFMSWILYLDYRFNWSIPKIGIFLMAIGITVGVFQGLLLKPLTLKMKTWYPNNFERLLICLPLCVYVVHFFTLAFISNGMYWFLLLPLSGLSSLSVPILRSVVLRTQPKEKYGSVSALFSTIGVIARIGGNSIFPKMLEISEKGEAFEGLLNLVASGIMVLGVISAVVATQKFNPNLLVGGEDLGKMGKLADELGDAKL